MDIVIAWIALAVCVLFTFVGIVSPKRWLRSPTGVIIAVLVVYLYVTTYLIVVPLWLSDARVRSALGLAALLAVLGGQAWWKHYAREKPSQSRAKTDPAPSLPGNGTVTPAEDKCQRERWRWSWEALAAIGTGVAALAAGAAVIVAWWQISDVVSARRAQNYVELRKIFFDRNKELDVVTGDPSIDAIHPNDLKCAQRNALRRYWYFVQTEWTVASIDESESKNWKEVQLPLTLVALKYSVYRWALLDMKETVLTTERGKAFVSELENAYAKAYPLTPITTDYVHPNPPNMPRRPCPPDAAPQSP